MMKSQLQAAIEDEIDQCVEGNDGFVYWTDMAALQVINFLIKENLIAIEDGQVVPASRDHEKTLPDFITKIT